MGEYQQKSDPARAESVAVEVALTWPAVHTTEEVKPKVTSSTELCPDTVTTTGATGELPEPTLQRMLACVTCAMMQAALPTVTLTTSALVPKPAPEMVI